MITHDNVHLVCVPRPPDPRLAGHEAALSQACEDFMVAILDNVPQTPDQQRALSYAHIAMLIAVDCLGGNG